MFMRNGFIKFSNGIINMGIIENYHIRKLFSCKIPLLAFYKFQRGRPRLYIKGMPLHTFTGSCILLSILKTLFKKVIDAISKKDQVDSPFY
ncbi:hypothetical protein T06_15470 [Trichinella sp. T6]|nr:hypothetical protein T06_15470 [Trichinella sp. T6]